MRNIQNKVFIVFLYLSFLGQVNNWLFMLGEKLKELREAKGLLQRQVAAELNIDNAYISKMEKNDKPVSKSYLSKLAVLYGVDEKELFTLWIADKVYDVVKDQDVALKAIEVVEDEIKQKQSRKS